MKYFFTAVLMLGNVKMATRENVTKKDFEALKEDAPEGTNWILFD